MNAHREVYQEVTAFLDKHREHPLTPRDADALARRLGGCPGSAFRGLARSVLFGELDTSLGECARKTMTMLDYLKRNANPNSLAAAQLSPSGLWQAQHFDGKNHRGMTGIAMAFYDALYGARSPACVPTDVTRQSDCAPARAAGESRFPGPDAPGSRGRRTRASENFPGNE